MFGYYHITQRHLMPDYAKPVPMGARQVIEYSNTFFIVSRYILYIYRPRHKANRNVRIDSTIPDLEIRSTNHYIKGAVKINTIRRNVSFILIIFFTGGALFGILGTKTTRWGRDPIVIMGYIIHLLSFFLIFINLPAEAPFGDTDKTSYITPSAALAMLCSFLLGFGDACFNTQIYSILGGNYSDNSTSAFALFKFTQVRIILFKLTLHSTAHTICSLCEYKDWYNEHQHPRTQKTVEHRHGGRNF